MVKTAPVGAAIIVDVNAAGTSLWSGHAGSRPTIADGATIGEVTYMPTPTIAEDQLLTVDIDQVGSTTPGANLTVALWYKYPLLTS